MDVHVVAMGGGGFSMNVDGGVTAFDRYVLAIPERPRPKVCFLPTASGDVSGYIDSFYAAFGAVDCEPTHLSLFRRDEAIGARCQGEDFSALAEQDIFYVGGGNTANLLAIWRSHGLDRALREIAATRRLVLCGLSAGGLCWFEGGITDSFGPDLAALPDGLGFTGGSFCPHYDGEAQRRPTYRRVVGAGDLPGGLAADDGAAVHFVNGSLRQAINERPGAQVYAVTRTESGAREEPLPMVAV